MLHQLFIIGGHRQREVLRYCFFLYGCFLITSYSDMLTYDVKSGEIKFLSNGQHLRA